MGEKMDYRDAADDADGFMAKHWMQAAGENGIPAAFVVGKDGAIAWVGHPSYPETELETVLAKVLDGSYDRKAFAESREKKKADDEKQSGVFKQISELAKEGKKKEAVEALDRAVVENPALKSRTAYYRFTLLIDADEAAAYTYARELAAGEFKKNAPILNALSSAITERNTKLQTPDYALALALAQQASETAQGKNPLFLAQIAEVHYRTHAYDQAIATVQQAITLAESDKSVREGTTKQLETRLERFKKMKEKRETKPVEEKN